MYVKTLPKQERLKELFNYNPERGELTWRISKSFRRPAGQTAGGLNGCGYPTVRVNNKAYLAHRIIWKLVTGEEPDVIDHINRIRNDNRISNLRNCTTADNASNRGISKANSSGIKGVNWKKDKAKWHCQITMKGRAIHLGDYVCPLLAGLRFKVAEKVRKRLHEYERMFKKLAMEHGIYMIPAHANNTIKYLSFKEDDLIEAIQAVFGDS